MTKGNNKTGYPEHPPESERFIFCLQPVNGNNKQKNTIARFALCLIVLIYRVIPNKNTSFF